MALENILHWCKIFAFFTMNVNRIAGKLIGLAQVMMEEEIINPLTFNSFSADDFRLDYHRLTVCLPWGGTIRFNPLEMTIYLLFLQHPSGIRREDLWQYYAELLELYGRMTVWDDSDKIEAVIDYLCDTDINGRFISQISHIRRKMSAQLGELVSLRFAINRSADGVYRITALIG